MHIIVLSAEAINQTTGILISKILSLNLYGVEEHIECTSVCHHSVE